MVSLILGYLINFFQKNKNPYIKNSLRFHIWNVLNSNRTKIDSITSSQVFRLLPSKYSKKSREYYYNSICTSVSFVRKNFKYIN